MVSVLLGFALALFLTTIVLPLCLRYSSQLGLIDAPSSDRKVHIQAIPRSGGVAIVIGTIVAASWWMPFDSTYLPLFAAIAVVVLTGYLDDRFDLSGKQKLAGQTIAALLLVSAYAGFSQVPFLPMDSAPTWLLLGWTLLFLIGVTNAVNLSDGLDGLAAGNTLLALVFLAVLGMESNASALTVLALALAGGLLGFLRFNTHPARLFMGDTGSQFLGFTAAAVTVLLMQQEASPVSPLLPLLVFGLPILDTLSVMAIRWLRGRPVFKADRSHLHHQLLRLGFKHYEVVAILYALQAIILLLAYVLRYESDIVLLLVYAAYCAAVIGGIVIARVGGMKVRAEAGGVDGLKERRNVWLRQMGWYYEHTAKVLAAGAGVLLVVCAAVVPSSDKLHGLSALAAAVTLTICWFFYRRAPQIITRLATFSATVFALFGLLMTPDVGSEWALGLDLYLTLLLALLVLAIRMTRKSIFHLDTQDFLVLFIVIGVPFLPLDSFDGRLVAQVVLRGIALMYVCEYVVTKGNGSRVVLGVAAIISLWITGLMSLG